jgi:hypothetical protein
VWTWDAGTGSGRDSARPRQSRCWRSPGPARSSDRCPWRGFRPRSEDRSPNPCSGRTSWQRRGPRKPATGRRRLPVCSQAAARPRGAWRRRSTPPRPEVSSGPNPVLPRPRPSDSGRAPPPLLWCPPAVPKALSDDESGRMWSKPLGRALLSGNDAGRRRRPHRAAAGFRGMICHPRYRACGTWGA